VGAVYSKREHFFLKGETEYRVLPDRLVIRRPGEPERALPWSEVRTVRASFAPTRAKTGRHVLVIGFRNGLRVAVDNIHFRGLADFEERSGPYSAFVRAAMERIAAEAPEAQAALGATRAGYVAQVLLVSVAFAFLALVVLTLPFDPGPTSWIKLGIVALLLPVLLRWLVRAFPRRVPLDPDAITGGLPPPKGTEAAA
jgi:hypothetical protein